MVYKTVVAALYLLLLFIAVRLKVEENQLVRAIE